jgi:type II secretory pathway pseudopilin PulG
MNNKFVFFIITKFKHKRLQLTAKDDGFTLIELLVAMVIAFLVITPLLGFMINIMDTDRKEQAKVNSEQETQSALDYIAQDLQQSIYIYDAKGIKAILDQLPKATDRVPVLVFWKREFESQKINVTSSGKITGMNDGFVYSLVAYYLIKNDSKSQWSNQLRIGRFAIKDGVRDPDNPTKDNAINYITLPDKGFQMFNLNETSGILEDKMNAWKNKSGEDYDNDAIALIDYIDKSPASTDKVLERVDCTTVFQDKNNKDTPQAKKDALRVPAFTGETYSYSDNTELDTGSFYACVDTDKSLVKVFIRGNALARIDQSDQNTYAANKNTYFPNVSIQVKGRGLIGVE